MRTVAKALTILDLFTEQRPSLSLTEVARATGIDTATCHRMLKVLEGHGYVFRTAATKHYSLGATVLRLARTRDNSLDSRFGVGYVPFENLVGRANIIFFSIADKASPLEIWKWPTEMRASRLFHFID